MTTGIGLSILGMWLAVGFSLVLGVTTMLEFILVVFLITFAVAYTILTTIIGGINEEITKTWDKN